jgi:hypothetical protein
VVGTYYPPEGSTPTGGVAAIANEGALQRHAKALGLLRPDSHQLPTLLPLTDTLSLEQHAAASLLVVRAGNTPKNAVEEAVTPLGRHHVLGILFNGVEGLNRLYCKYGYHRGNTALARSGQSLVHQVLAAIGDTYWVQMQNAPTPTSGTTVTINDTAPTTDRYNLTICEILAAQ